MLYHVNWVVVAAIQIQKRTDTLLPHRLDLWRLAASVHTHTQRCRSDSAASIIAG